MPTSTQTKTTRPRALRLCLGSLAVLCALAFATAGCGGGGAKENSPFLAHNETTGSNPFTTPSNLVIVENEVGKYTLTWDPVAGADHYEISVNGGGEGYVVSATNTTYVDTNITAASRDKYKYAVSACKGTICSWKTQTMTFLYYPTRVASKVIESTSNFGITVSWDSEPYATSYTVYRSCGNSDETSFSTTVQSFDDTGLTAQKSYKYCVSACNSATCTVKSPPSDLYEFLPTPANVTALIESPFKISMTWGAVATATTYNLFVTAGGVTDTKIINPPNPPSNVIEYALTGLKMNTAYTLTVNACNKQGSKSNIDICSLTSSPVQVTTTAAQTITVDSSVATVGLANAVPVGITATGSYSVSFTKGAIKSTSDTDVFQEAVIYSHTLGTVTEAALISLTPVTSNASMTFFATDSLAIMIEADSVTNNSKFSVLTLSQAGKAPVNAVLAGFGNAVQLTAANSRDITAAELPAGSYKAKLTAATMPFSHDGVMIFEKMLIYYQDASGVPHIVILGNATNETISITKNDTDLYAFFLDDKPSAVSGTVDLVFTP